MKNINKFKIITQGIGKGIDRFSITILMLVALVVLMWNRISSGENDINTKWILSLAIGISLSVTLQVLYERFFHQKWIRIVLIVVSVISVGICYLVLTSTNFNLVVGTRLGILLFVFHIAFLWVPTINSKISFPQTFLAAFKALLLSGIYAGIIYLGILLILGATNLLITPVDGMLLAHAANVTFLLFMPIYYLSLIPKYHGNVEEEELRKGITSNKFLDTLISYILIPISGIFTAILIIYIVTNITNSLWADNLMEPILVSYSISVIIIYLLACCVDRTIVKYFRKVFPFVLVFVVLIQTVASIYILADTGVTYGRYYVILFGVFALIAGVIFILDKHIQIDWIAPILIVLAFISIVPPVDAFTSSKRDQIGRLEDILIKNNMIENDKIIPNTNISSEDRIIITQAYDALSTLEELDQIVWFENHNSYVDFEKVFGFNRYNNDIEVVENQYYNQHLAYNVVIPIGEYDYFIQSDISSHGDNIVKLAEFTLDDQTYILQKKGTNHVTDVIVLSNEKEEIILELKLEEVYQRVQEMEFKNTEMPLEDGTFTTENENWMLTLIGKNLHYEIGENRVNYSIDGIFLIKTKK